MLFGFVVLVGRSHCYINNSCSKPILIIYIWQPEAETHETEAGLAFLENI